MTAKCRLCGDTFPLSKEEIWEDGECDLPSICDECYEMQEQNFDDLGISDADIGL